MSEINFVKQCLSLQPGHAFQARQVGFAELYELKYGVPGSHENGRLFVWDSLEIWARCKQPMDLHLFRGSIMNPGYTKEHVLAGGYVQITQVDRFNRVGVTNWWANRQISAWTQPDQLCDFIVTKHQK